ncbi:MAG: CRISPR-associated protein Csn1 [Alistipes sp.]|nr:CRISPR-associated protein Csn1 [Alistipes sp.]
MAKVLGLDLGTSSIGWAITERTEDNITLLDKGVDIFQEGVNRTKSGEEPMVKIRTDARALRRHYMRRRLRKIELLKVLIAYDMCPDLTSEDLNQWRYQKIYPLNEEFLLWQRTDDNSGKNPYHDRHTALTTKLDLSKQSNRHLLGRAFYHLSQRRGFLSNRKEQTDEKSQGAVNDGINAINIAMGEYGCTYIGEYFYKLYCEGEPIRKHYTSRKEHFVKEFEAICDKQQLDNKLRRALYRAIFFQRPLKSQKGLVGGCTFEKGKPRCSISHPRFEEFRMWAFINNIRVCGPYDTDYRALSQSEVEAILPLFYRKSKAQFDFEDIAKLLAGKKRGMYAYREERCEAPYKFNFRMSHSVSGCPVTAQLKGCLGEDWVSAICSLYTKSTGKSEEQIVNDVWHSLYSFDDEDKLRAWAEQNLQLSEENAKAFAKIKLPNDYASLSLCAINKILPHLRSGFRYDEAVFLANLKDVVANEIWQNEEYRSYIIEQVAQTIADFIPKGGYTKERAIFDCLLDCGLATNQFDERKLYHPSMIETYQEATPNKLGILQLGSPRTNAVRNPMAMRALFRLRALINKLLCDGKIDQDTKINIEFSRGLNNANKRRAIEQVQRDNEKEHQKYADSIRKLYFEQCGISIEPTKEDILKYQLWEEQNHICLYTGNRIGICDFVGSSPQYDIEHTVPRSRGGDNSQENKTLCECSFNRDIKRAKLPSELSNSKEILARIEQLGWNEKIADLHKQIERTKGTFSTKEIKDAMIQKRHRLTMQLRYWEGKLGRFTMTEVPEDFENRQGVDVGIIGRYARLYLQTVFRRIYMVKGSTTSDFRKAWGLQESDEKKSRANHVHHCIDAIVIACIGSKEYQAWAHYISNVERSRWGLSDRTRLPKPWATFTEDVKAIANELLISHHTPNNMHKHSRKKLRVRGKIQYNKQGEPIYMQGDTARGALHMQTFYGAIKHNDEVKYVVRKSLDSLQQSDVDKIVDDAVRECVKAAIAKEGFKEAVSKPICFNEAKGVYIKKVRIFTPSVTNPIHLKKHRDQSRFEHKCDYYVANDSNHCIAIYEGIDGKGKTKRNFQIVNNLEAAKFYNGKSNNCDIVPFSDANDYPLKYILRTGTMVLFYEKSASELYECSKAELTKRLYKVTGMSEQIVSGIYHYGTLTLKHHQEARPAGELKAKGGEYQQGEEYRPVIGLKHTQFNALVEGYDFDLTITGEIKFKH